MGVGSGGGDKLFSCVIVQLELVQQGSRFVLYMLRKAHNYALHPVLSEVCPTLPLKQFQCSSDWTMAFSRPFKKDHRALPLSTPLSSRRLMV